MKPILTIFTPTFNRAYTLHLCYESLKRQTMKDFLWLIIDDGSTDHTREMVQSWIDEKIINIRYHYQENQGMHGAHNTAYDLIDTELNVCIDSDDYMPDNAVEKIVTFWRAYGSDQYAGIVGLDAGQNGEIIGTRLPEQLQSATLQDLYALYKVKGDKKLVYRTELTKKVPPYPQFPGEKYCPLATKYIFIDQECPLLIMNEVLCYVEYLHDGSSMNIIKQYKRNPRGFAYYRKLVMRYGPRASLRFRAAVHYVSSNLLMKNHRFLNESTNKLMTILAIPLGIVLFFYIRHTRKTTVLKSG
ncbi:MAG: glycosyltransferase family A protein [Tuberibacillus sp.]